VAQCEFDGKEVVQFHPALHKFPHPAQDLTAKELQQLYKTDMELANNDEVVFVRY
jgi:hypothetical protein